jgi:hypothetical protein
MKKIKQIINNILTLFVMLLGLIMLPTAYLLSFIPKRRRKH